MNVFILDRYCYHDTDNKPLYSLQVVDIIIPDIYNRWQIALDILLIHKTSITAYYLNYRTSASSLTILRQHLKTFLFRLSYRDHILLFDCGPSNNFCYLGHTKNTDNDDDDDDKTITVYVMALTFILLLRILCKLYSLHKFS